MGPINLVLDSDNGPNLICEDVLGTEWLVAMKSENRPELRSVTNHKMAIMGVINLLVRIGKA